ncbi:MAG: sulfide/dihydroorotate dehydrogenase-like FAD/NAD-binding protein [Candidatus Omnitrophica bacterium]|nr:sulfide/dihydroorotate dehydrogenase-like FAD/NAD-binding protein [Candidatus Omnitrophota bacterium]
MRIVSKEFLVDGHGMRIAKLAVKSPEIASKAKAGQFVVLMVEEKGERIPLTIVEADASNGLITIIVQAAGFTSSLLAGMNEGDTLYSIVGPLGHPTDVKKYGKVALIGGGVGIAEIYPVAKAMKDRGNYVAIIIGARSKDLLILEKELTGIADEMVVMTDDGSYGRKGFVTDALKQLLGREKYDLAYAVGPIPMMRAVSDLSKSFAVVTLVSLNAIMVDGTGMCGCCRVKVGNDMKFSCVDGPEFEAWQVDWQELSIRNGIYAEQEKHICRLNKA